MNKNSENEVTSLHVTGFTSEKFIICIEEFEKVYKIFQIIFRKDGSIFINFPYYRTTNGIVSRLTHPKNTINPIDINLEYYGNVTSNSVKYSHHFDGNTHFSQDGKILTKIRNKAFPLQEINGHLFTVMLQGIKDFTEYHSVDNHTSPLKKQTLIIPLTGPEPESIKLIGLLYTWEYFESIIKKTNRHSSEEPYIIQEVMKNGKILHKMGVIIGPPQNKGYNNFILTLWFEAIPKIDKDRPSCLTFFAGFDAKPTDTQRDLNFLFLCYPIDNYEELKNRIGSLDIVSNLNKN